MDKYCFNRFKKSNAAKHFAFVFETTDLHNLLNFEFSLIDYEENLVQFATGEEKIQALNFTIQIIC